MVISELIHINALNRFGDKSLWNRFKVQSEHRDGYFDRHGLTLYSLIELISHQLTPYYIRRPLSNYYEMGRSSPYS